MNTTVTAKRWADLYELEPPHSRHGEKKAVTLKLKAEAKAQQQRRAKRVNVCRLDYYAEATPTSARCDKIGELSAFLAPVTRTEGTEPRPKLRLFVVEDLSRDVIEQFGSTFDVDPSFSARIWWTMPGATPETLGEIRPASTLHPSSSLGFRCASSPLGISQPGNASRLDRRRRKRLMSSDDRIMIGTGVSGMACRP